MKVQVSKNASFYLDKKESISTSVNQFKVRKKNYLILFFNKKNI